MENQSLAVAEAVGLPIETKRARTRPPWKWLPAALRFGALKRLDPSGDLLIPPWPRLLITTGRHSVPLSITIRKASGGQTFTVHIQNPKTSLQNFDLVAAPLHDRISGRNVVVTMGAPHRVTAARLSTDGRRAVEAKVAHLKRPFVTLLLGGHSKAFRFTDDKARELAIQVRDATRAAGGSLLITPSRRTPASVVEVLRNVLGDIPHVIWDGSGDNPYFDFLAMADFIVVTGDSVNMVTEAAGTGKPVYVFQLEGRSARFDEFHDQMARRGATRPLAHKLETWSYEPVNDTEKIAERIRTALNLPQPE